ncbi:macro domain-containing protein [Flindersiella endophytica]
MTNVAGDSGMPTYDDLTSELRQLRERGLVQLRWLELPALSRAAEIHARATNASGHRPAAIEALLRTAVERLGTGQLGQAAQYTFCLAQGTRDWPAQDRRRKAAEIYGLSTERFRKAQEHTVVNQVAEAILNLCGEPRPGPAAAGEPAPAARPDRRLQLRLGDAEVELHVHTTSIDLLSGIDILVSSENVYLEMAKTYRTSVSATLRRAGARSGMSGEIQEDTIERELRAWVDANASPGLAVAPGTVAATSAGQLAERSIRRIYHAAVVVPLQGGYEVDPAAIARATHNTFQLAARERRAVDPTLRSICFPLLGAGRGGLGPEVSFGWIWSTVRQELAADPTWTVHFVSRRESRTAVIVRTLLESGATEQPSYKP